VGAGSHGGAVTAGRSARLLDVAEHECVQIMARRPDVEISSWQSPMAYL
jgi:hypothetical protein